jgi:hypothetical protein
MQTKSTQIYIYIYLLHAIGLWYDLYGKPIQAKLCFRRSLGSGDQDRRLSSENMLEGQWPGLLECLSAQPKNLNCPAR